MFPSTEKGQSESNVPSWWMVATLYLETSLIDGFVMKLGTSNVCRREGYFAVIRS